MYYQYPVLLMIGISDILRSMFQLLVGKCFSYFIALSGADHLMESK